MSIEELKDNLMTTKARIDALKAELEIAEDEYNALEDKIDLATKKHSYPDWDSPADFAKWLREENDDESMTVPIHLAKYYSPDYLKVWCDVVAPWYNHKCDFWTLFYAANSVKNFAQMSYLYEYGLLYGVFVSQRYLMELDDLVASDGDEASLRWIDNKMNFEEED